MTITAADISVVICAYTDERWPDLLAAIASVKDQSAPPLEIIVVIDNNPALLERVRAEVPTVKAIENTEVRGLGRVAQQRDRSRTRQDHRFPG